MKVVYLLFLLYSHLFQNNNLIFKFVQLTSNPLNFEFMVFLFGEESLFELLFPIDDQLYFVVVIGGVDFVVEGVGFEKGGGGLVFFVVGFGERGLDFFFLFHPLNLQINYKLCGKREERYKENKREDKYANEYVI